MTKNIFWFIGGGATAVILMTLYSGQSIEETSDTTSLPEQSASPAQARTVVRDNGDRAPSAAGAGLGTADVDDTMGGLDESIDEASREPAAMLQQFAESLRSTTDEVLRLMEENLNALASDPDRQERFGNDAVSDGPRLFQLENLVTNELWRNANDNPPINVEPVCYPTGCRLKLFFANTEELVAVASGALHLRMLFALREYGFGSAETKLDFRELDPETGPEVPAEAVDVFLWPKSDSRLQSEPSLSLG